MRRNKGSLRDTFSWGWKFTAHWYDWRATARWLKV
jgi:hypothetical protein